MRSRVGCVFSKCPKSLPRHCLEVIQPESRDELARALHYIKTVRAQHSNRDSGDRSPTIPVSSRGLVLPDSPVRRSPTRPAPGESPTPGDASGHLTAMVPPSRLQSPFPHRPPDPRRAVLFASRLRHSPLRLFHCGRQRCILVAGPHEQSPTTRHELSI